MGLADRDNRSSGHDMPKLARSVSFYGPLYEVAIKHAIIRKEILLKRSSMHVQSLGDLYGSYACVSASPLSTRPRKPILPRNPYFIAVFSRYSSASIGCSCSMRIVRNGDAAECRNSSNSSEMNLQYGNLKDWRIRIFCLVRSRK